MALLILFFQSIALATSPPAIAGWLVGAAVVGFVMNPQKRSVRTRGTGLILLLAGITILVIALALEVVNLGTLPTFF